MTAGARLPRHKGLEVARPPDISDARWQTAMAGLQRFVAAGWGEKAAALGWSRDELYAAPPLWSRVDLCGAALLIGDNEVVGISATEIRVKTPSGSTQAFRRRGEFDLGRIYSDRLKLIVGNVGEAEARARAYDYAIAAYRNHTGASLEAAKAAVMDAISKGRQP